jgi:O-methyltransferase
VSELLRLLYETLAVKPLARLGWRPGHGVPLAAVPRGGRFGYDDEAAIRAAAARVASHSMTTFERLATLWQQVRYLDRAGIAGELVECGVWKGGAVGMMALAHLAGREGRAPERTLHLFDSFEGLPAPRAEVDGAAAERFTGGCVGTLADNRHLLEERIGYPPGLLRYHAGWFEETVPRDAPGFGPIALLRLDGDWYESTRTCLEHLYPKVVVGGVVVIDDYGHWQGCRQAVDEYLAGLAEPVLLHHVDYTCRCWVRVSPR